MAASHLSLEAFLLQGLFTEVTSGCGLELLPAPTVRSWGEQELAHLVSCPLRNIFCGSASSQASAALPAVLG